MTTIEKNIIHHTDAIEFLKSLPDKCIDMVLVDPPYNISKKNDNRDRSQLNSPVMRRKKPLNYDFGEWDNFEREDFFDFTKKWLKECCRVLKEDGTIISFFNKEDISFLGWTAKEFGIRTRTIFTWHKTNPVPSFRKVNYLSSTEFIWIGSKGKFKTFNFLKQKEMHNFFETPNSSIYGKTKHPTEKPISLISHFIKIHTNEGDVVLDPFLGSGTTAIACLKNNRKFIGIEINEEYVKIARERVEKWNKQKRISDFYHREQKE